MIDGDEDLVQQISKWGRKYQLTLIYISVMLTIIAIVQVLRLLE